MYEASLEVASRHLAVKFRGGEVPKSSEKIHFLSFYFNFPFLVVFFLILKGETKWVKDHLPKLLGIAWCFLTPNENKKNKKLKITQSYLEERP